MRFVMRCTGLFLVLAMAQMAAGADWPQWRGANTDGRALETGVLPMDGEHGLKVAWKKSLGSGYSSISIADGFVVAMFSDHEFDWVAALDEATGNEKWRFKIDATYVGHDGSHDGTLASPAIANGTVFALGPNGHLLALAADTGKKLWATHLVDDHQGEVPIYGYTSSPIVVSKVLVVQNSSPEGKMVLGFDTKTGKLLWSAGTGTVVYQSPILTTLQGREQVVCAGNQNVFGLDPKDGTILWEYQHEGNYPSAHPVPVGDNLLYVRRTNREGVLLRIAKSDTGLAAEEVWTSREIRGTFNVAVHHDGYLYGYAGRFLVCMDAKTGEQAWKSREPGDGFLIWADGYLVVVTKAGTLHIVEASPKGYNEVANLDVFGKLTWTPPSFANGKIFVRDLEEIAAVEVVKTKQPLAIAEEVVEQPPSEFAKLVAKIEAADDKKAMVDQFMAKHEQLPVIENNTLVHFIWRGEAKDMAIRGDMLTFQEQPPMNRVKGTDLFYYTVTLEPDAHVCYQLIKDFDNRIADPGNPRTATTFNGEESELGMPEWKAPKHLDEPTGKTRGTIKTHELESKIIEGTRTLRVYLPPGYADSGDRYPVVYVNHGDLAVEGGLLPNTLDNLIGDGAIVPVIAVFIHAPNSIQEYVRRLSDDYARLVVEEVVPFIDGKLRTIAKPESRAFMGGDEGGFSAMYTAFTHPGTFSMVAGQGSHLWNTDGDRLKETITNAGKQPIRFYLDWGTYDARDEGYDWADFNRDFADFVKKLGYDVVAHEVHDGYGWCSWRNRTDQVLKTFFGTEGAK